MKHLVVRWPNCTDIYYWPFETSLCNTEWLLTRHSSLLDVFFIVVCVTCGLVHFGANDCVLHLYGRCQAVKVLGFCNKKQALCRNVRGSVFAQTNAIIYTWQVLELLFFTLQVNMDQSSNILIRGGWGECSKLSYLASLEIIQNYNYHKCFHIVSRATVFTLLSSNMLAGEDRWFLKRVN